MGDAVADPIELAKLFDVDVDDLAGGGAFARKSSSAARSPTSRPRLTASGRTASRHSSIEGETPSNACSAA
jgi:hypothetical protein